MLGPDFQTGQLGSRLGEFHSARQQWRTGNSWLSVQSHYRPLIKQCRGTAE